MKSDFQRFQEDLVRAIKTLLNVFARRSDVARWGKRERYESFWDERTRLIAGMIPPESNVVEFGPGRLLLPRLLGEGSRYFAVDLTQGEGVDLVLDLNDVSAVERADVAGEVAVFGGVLEYVFDVPALVRWVASRFEICIASYSPLTSPSSGQRRGRGRLQRVSQGWVNSYSVGELEEIFLSCGFAVHDRRGWRNQFVWFLRSVRFPRGHE